MFEKLSVEQYCEKLASEAPTPGGGSALAMVAATACSLIEMSIAITVAKLPETDEKYGYLTSELNSCNRAKKCFYKLSDDDATAYGNIVEARKLKKDTDEEAKIRAAAMQKAFHKATLVPLDVMQLANDVLHRAQNRVLKNLSKYVASDCEIGISLLKTVITYSIKNVYANTVYIRDEKLKTTLEKQATDIINGLSKI